MRFPDVNVIVGLMLYFEGAAFAECNLGQSLKQATKKRSKKGSDKDLAAIQIWICVGRPKMCWVSYRKAWNNKAWPLPLAWSPLLLLQPRVLGLPPLLRVWNRAAHLAEWQQIRTSPNPSKCLWGKAQSSSQERSVQLPCIAACAKTQQ